MQFVTLTEKNLDRVAKSIGTTSFQVYFAFIDRIRAEPFVIIDLDTWRKRWAEKRVFDDHEAMERFEMTEMVRQMKGLDTSMMGMTLVRPT